MTFPTVVTSFWRDQLAGDELHRSAGFRLTVNPDMPDGWRAQVHERPDDAAAAVSPELAEISGLRDEPSVDVAGFGERFARSGVELHSPDRLFYVTTSDRPGLLDQAAHSPARVLGPDDAKAFSQFEASASPADLDDAYVELDHWAVVGVFEEGRLACASSAYPWQGSTLADIGVLTLASARGKGYGRAAVQALCALVYARGYEPQYRCQPDNRASAALALAAGFTPFGSWQVAAGAGDD